MNTAAVAKLLGVSRRTLMRWVDQLDLQLAKNELGHYQFSDADVESLKQLQHETNQQVPKQDEEKQLNSRKEVVKTSIPLDTNILETLNGRMNELERTIRGKADDVVSYQLLQHRQETEELLNRIINLEARILELENAQPKRDARKEKMLVFDQAESPATSTEKRPRRKNLISSIFSL